MRKFYILAAIALCTVPGCVQQDFVTAVDKYESFTGPVYMKAVDNDPSLSDAQKQALKDLQKAHRKMIDEYKGALHE